MSITTYDIPNSAVGYLYLSQDAQASLDFWRLTRAMQARHVKLYDRAEDMVHEVEHGDAALGYDVVGSYAVDEAARDPSIGVVLFRDYTLLMSRIALITRPALHPAAARLFVDFMLSKRGQRYLAEQDIPSVRSDVATVDGLRTRDVPLRAIRVGPGLLVMRDALTRRYFLRRWHAKANGDG